MTPSDASPDFLLWLAGAAVWLFLAWFSKSTVERVWRLFFPSKAEQLAAENTDAACEQSLAA